MKRSVFLIVVALLAATCGGAGATAQTSEAVRDVRSMNLEVEALYQAGRREEALARAEVALAVAERRLGEDHPNTLTSVNNLAFLYQQRGHYSEAEPLYIRALEARERTLGADHRHTLTSLNNLALLYQEQGRFNEAAPLNIRAVQGRERTLGANHLETIESANNLAHLYYLQGRLREAEPLYLSALEGFEGALGLNHPNTLIVVSNLALLYLAQGRYTEAESFNLRALESREETLGADHRDTLVSVNNLALLYHHQGRFNEVESLHSRALESFERTLGSTHPSTLTSANNLASLYQDQRRYSEAESLFFRTLETRERTLGASHPDTLISTNNLANLYQNQGRYREAAPLIRRTLESREQTLGANHPDTLTSVNNLARLYHDQGRHGEAHRLYWRALDGMLSVQGPTHPSVGTTFANLGYLLAGPIDRPESAVLYLKQAVNVFQGMRADMAELADTTQAAFLEQHRPTYERLQSLLIDQGRFAEAALVGRMLKEQEFYDYIRRRTDEAEDPRQTVVPFTRREQDLLEQIEDWRERPVRLAQEHDALIAQRRAAGASWNAAGEARLVEMRAALNASRTDVFTQINALELQGIELADENDGQYSREIATLNARAADSLKAALRQMGDDGPRTAILQLLALEDATHLFLITRDALVHAEAPVGRADLNAMIFTTRAMPGIGEPVPAGQVDLAVLQVRLGNLYDALVRPMEVHIADAEVEVLLIDAQGPIRYVPFAALHDGEAYLAERVLLARYTSAAPTDYRRLAPDFAMASAFGVTQPHDGFRALPYAGREVEMLVTGADGHGVVEGAAFIDAAFTRRALEHNLDQADILHIATHYRMEVGDETASRLLLGDGGYLTPADLHNSPVFEGLHGVDIVTLSACETALNTEGIGAEVDGLGAIIQYRGANTVLATLWAVADDSTARFMEDFYRGLVDEDRNKAEAIQAAQAAMITSGRPEPYYWAPYILMGNWR